MKLDTESMLELDAAVEGFIAAVGDGVEPAKVLWASQRLDAVVEGMTLAEVTLALASILAACARTLPVPAVMPLAVSILATRALHAHAETQH